MTKRQREDARKARRAEEQTVKAMMLFFICLYFTLGCFVGVQCQKTMDQKAGSLHSTPK